VGTRKNKGFVGKIKNKGFVGKTDWNEYILVNDKHSKKEQRV
jgi:hypothetical protein